MSLPLVSFPTLGWQVIDWIETYLVHGPGDVEGDTWEIDDEIAVHICWLYRVYPQDHPKAGRRMVQRGVLSRPKGRAKSEIAGGLVCAEALGPVRCDGFDADGEPVGIPVRYPFIRCLATEEDQSGNTYDNVRYMLEEGEVANEYDLDVGLTRTFIKEPGGGEIVPSTSGNASKDGGKESFSVADETHLYVLPKLRQMYGTVARNTGKRKIAEPWMLDTTTAWQPGENSVAEQVADRYAHLEVEEAVTKKGVLYDHHQGDEPKRFGDDRSLKKALKTGYGPAAEWMDFDRIVRLIRDAEDPEADAYRYWLNRPRAAASHWISPDELEGVFEEFEPPKGARVALGFDGSDTDDHTVLWGSLESGDLFPIGIWTPDGQLGWRQDVMDAVAWAYDYFDVRRHLCDPAWWQEEVAKWAEKHGSPPVAEFWMSGRSETKAATACGALRTAIRNKTIKIASVPLRTDEIKVGGKSLARAHFENARTKKVLIKTDEKAEDAYTVRKERPGSALKIDSVPGAALALRGRDEALKLGKFAEPEYEVAQW